MGFDPVSYVMGLMSGLLVAGTGIVFLALSIGKAKRGK